MVTDLRRDSASRFPDDLGALPSDVVRHVAAQLEVEDDTLARYDLAGRSGKRHRAEIREMTGFRECAAADLVDVSAWLASEAKAQADDEQLFDLLLAKAHQRLRDLKIEPPTPERAERLVRSAARRAEQHLFATLAAGIPEASKAAIDGLLKPADASLSLTELKADPGRPGLESIFQEIAKLTRLRSLALPEGVFDGVSRKLLQRHKQRVAAESLHETGRHPDKVRYTLVASFCHLRSQEITDSLIEILIQIIHGIGARSKRKVEKEMLTDLRKVSGKSNILCQLAETAVAHPDGVIRDVVFPVVSEKTLKALVKELKASGPFTYRSKVQTVMRASYGSHYRRMVPAILAALEFRSNNDMHQPVIRGLELLRRYSDTRVHYFAAHEDVPIKGVVRKDWRDLVVEVDKDGKKRINRINYELALLKALRDRLRCKGNLGRRRRPLPKPRR